MNVDRPTLDELKDDWCNGNLKILAGFSGGRVDALPLHEAEKAERYIELLKNVRTYSEAQALYEFYKQDPLSPRLTPILFDLKSEIELLDARVQQEYRRNGDHRPGRWEEDPGALPEGSFATLVENFECSLESLWEEVKDLSFSLHSDPTYNSVEDSAYICDPRFLTDFWIPREIAEEIGSVDDGYGLDYVTTEYLYQDIRSFERAFLKHGYHLIVDQKRIEYLIYGWA